MIGGIIIAAAINCGGIALGIFGFFQFATSQAQAEGTLIPAPVLAGISILAGGVLSHIVFSLAGSRAGTYIEIYDEGFTCRFQRRSGRLQVDGH